MGDKLVEDDDAELDTLIASDAVPLNKLLDISITQEQEWEQDAPLADQPIDSADSLEATATALVDLVKQFDLALSVIKKDENIQPAPRATLKWVNEAREDLEDILDFHDNPDGTIQPTDPALNEWIKPFNELVLAEKELADADPIGPFKQQYLHMILQMGDGDWLKHVGMPKENGLEIHIATSPDRKGCGIVGETMNKFREKFYAHVRKEKVEVNEVEEEAKDFILSKCRLAFLKKIGTERERRIGQRLMELRTAAKKAGTYVSDNDGCDVVLRSNWRSETQNKNVWIFEIITPGKTFIFLEIRRIARNLRRLEIFVNTEKASRQYTISQEMKALEKLREMVTPEEYDHYIITGTLREQSKRSGVIYYLRKLKPTLAFRERKDPKGRWHDFLCGLCLHPMAYYLSSFAGCLCPTDDVIVHLLWIRGDEHGFWSKANHHSLKEIELGMP